MRNHKILAKCITYDYDIITSTESATFKGLMYPIILHNINYYKDAKKVVHVLLVLVVFL